MASLHKNLRFSSIQVLLTLSSHLVRAEATGPSIFGPVKFNQFLQQAEMGAGDFVESARCQHFVWVDGRREDIDKSGKVSARLVKVQYQEARGHLKAASGDTGAVYSRKRSFTAASSAINGKLEGLTWSHAEPAKHWTIGGVGSVHDEDQRGCSIIVKVLGMDWTSYFVFLQIFSRCGPRRADPLNLAPPASNVCFFC